MKRLCVECDDALPEGAGHRRLRCDTCRAARQRAQQAESHRRRERARADAERARFERIVDAVLVAGAGLPPEAFDLKGRIHRQASAALAARGLRWCPKCRSVKVVQAFYRDRRARCAMCAARPRQLVDRSAARGAARATASEFGERLYRARIAAELKQEEVADLLGVSKTTLGRWEFGQFSLGQARLLRLLSLLKLDVGVA